MSRAKRNYAKQHICLGKWSTKTKYTKVNRRFLLTPPPSSRSKPLIIFAAKISFLRAFLLKTTFHFFKLIGLTNKSPKIWAIFLSPEIFSSQKHLITTEGNGKRTKYTRKSEPPPCLLSNPPPKKNSGQVASEKRDRKYSKLQCTHCMQIPFFVQVTQCIAAGGFSLEWQVVGCVA